MVEMLPSSGHLITNNNIPDSPVGLGQTAAAVLGN